jgi:hypothetical protein
VSLTLAQARDAAISVVDAAWKASGAATETVAMQYGNVKQSKPSESGSSGSANSYARISVQVISQPQATIGARRRYESLAILTVQIFTPFGDGHELADAYAQVVLDVVRSHVGGTDGIWFGDSRSFGVGIDGPHFQTNATAEFRWQEVV